MHFQLGLIGRSLVHSASAAYFAAKFEREGVADCTYSLYELARIEDLKPLLEQTPNLRGFNVTIPYKREIIPLLNSLSDEARAVGAVNCVRRDAEGRLVGYNTDIIGLRASFDLLLGDFKPQHALILGTGGASHAVQYSLTERGIDFSLVSRGSSGGDYTYDNLPSEVIAHTHLIINASPVGTYPAGDDAPKIDYGSIGPRHYMLDLVYNPPITRFLDFGRRQGAKILGGETMFREQAEASWRIWKNSD